MSDMSGQSTGDYRPAGWYYAQGDPPGTQRYWDGAAWQGEPQPVNPSPQYSAPDSPPSQRSDPGEFGGYQAPATMAGSTPGTAPDPATAYAANIGAAAPPADPSESTGSSGSTGTSGSTDVGGFLSTLFDTSFNKFITGRAIAVVYILAIVGIALMTLFIVLSGIAGGGSSALAALIIGPIIGLIYLVMIRMTLEFFVNQYRQTELLETIAEKLDQGSD